MRRLTRVELRRLFSRRLTFAAGIGVLVALGFILFGVVQEARPLSPAEQQTVQRQFQAAHADWAAHADQMRTDCLANQADARTRDPKADLGCGNLEPRLANFGKPQAVFTEVMPSVLGAVAYLLAFAAFLVGATFVGAELTSGAMSTWLTFEPRRLRVYTSKLLAAGLGVLPAAAAALLLVLAAGWLIVAHYGTTAGTTASTWGALGAVAGRALALAGAAAVAGGAIGLLVRHTAAALGLAMGYLVLVEGIFAHQLRDVRPWLMQINIESWVHHGAAYSVNRCQVIADGSYTCEGVMRQVSFGHSTAYLAVLLAVALTGTALVFRRRDLS
jgi:ABC-2 type transport system permease protein